MARRNFATAIKDTYDDFAHRREGPVARAIESQTAKVPSDWYLWAALGSMAVSAFLQANDKRERSLFIGQWAPSFLLLGIYNKIVKTQGSD